MTLYEKLWVVAKYPLFGPIALQEPDKLPKKIVVAAKMGVECAKHGCEPSFGGHKENCRSFSIYLEAQRKG